MRPIPLGYEADLALIAEGCTPVMVPKAESSDAISSFPDGTAVVALIETVVGIERSATVCSAPGVHQASAPSDEEVAWAQKVLATGDAGGGVSAAGGQMVDLPVVQRAKGIIDAVDRC
jgi:citrate lyase beta subunit